MDVGTGYGRPPGTFHEELTLVSPGTPCGEFMRRYWQPVAMATGATSTPKLIKALGEELVLFRDGSGRPGLLLPRCVHRGASLYFGATEERGLRCCYHGWLFDAEGYCLEQPCEPRGVQSVQLRTLRDGSTLRRITEVMFPNLRIVPSPKLALGRTPWISWVLPLDDTSFRIYTIGRVTEPGAIANARSTYGGKPWHELTDEEHRAMPGDYESQRSQGVFQLHSLESLSTTDQGVTMLRRSLRREIERVAAGENPAGVTHDPAEAQIAIEGGNFILSATNRS
jgi:nitrite reductase/ring-hydroxylating ferredoxin subunit